jgi:uncharacterized membrane protein
MILASAFFDVLPATLILLAFVVIGGVIIFSVRKMLKSSTPKTETFLLSDLRKMLDTGAISEEEYERAKQSIINKSR